MHREVFGFFKNLVSIRSVSAKNTGIYECANFLKSQLEKFGFETKILYVKNANPAVYASYNSGSDKTILFYNHYDVQPEEPVDKWRTPPFKLTLKNGKLYGRGASDNKGGIVSRIEAVLDCIKENNLRYNVKFFIDGEEEIGSPYIDIYLSKYKEELEHDLLIWEGYGNTFDGYPVIPFGCKGLVYFELRCKVADKDIHSSRAPLLKNPALRLFEAVVSMCGSDGSIKIQKFSSDVKVSASHIKAVKKYLFDFDYFKKNYGVKDFADSDIEALKRKLILEPWINVSGFYSGYTGIGAKTILPSEAICKIDVRTVPGQKNEDVLRKIKKHIYENGFRDVELIELETKMEPVRYSYNSYIIKRLLNMAEEIYGKVFILPNMPATGPASSFKKYFNSHFFDIGCGYTGSAEHAPDEHIRLRDYIKSVKFFKRVLGGELWRS